ncbi:MAG: FAD-dependent oxidoreductase [Chloroflexota bacterium]|nr:FAD-dependent oxidoreductase [Chloroflexota bacterium]
MAAGELTGEITVYGTAWCSDCKRSKRFLGEQRVPYRWVDVDDDAEGLKFIESVQNGGHSVPTILFADGSTLLEPSNSQLAEKLGISTRAKQSFYDVVIVGGGPTGLTAALYTSREGFTTLVIDGAGLGGQVGITECLDNFPGFPEGITGSEFAARLVQQAQRFGVELISAQPVTEIIKDDSYTRVRTADGAEYCAHALLVATGAKYRRLNIKGEESLIGTSVHYCATCDGPFYRGREVAVIGGGNSAVEEGLFLANFASHVTLLVRGDHLEASHVALDKLHEQQNVDVRYNVEVAGLEGAPKLTDLLVKDRTTGKVGPLTPRPAGLFVFIGLTPNSAFLPAGVEIDAQGFIVTSATLETSMLGVFAAGDVRASSTHQAASAVGEGATAALMIRNYLHKMG